MRALLSLLLALAAALLLARWNERREAAEELAARPGPAQAAAELGPLSSAWLRSELERGVREAPSPSALRQDLEGWGPPDRVRGWEALAQGAAGRCARLELARWLQVRPGAGGRAVALELTPSADRGSLELSLELTGPPAAVLPWLAHLLELPVGAGYLTDPQRVALSSAGEAGIRALLVLRVVPQELLLGEES